ncbi:translation initiation factor IF-2-like [Panthera pardus]|uniref:Translation initiation factor IF-2-like n=1 Tax=Panthera pardus TaxID=9691 RepID=A0A9W2UTN0_PANPR|nr:translation initiation factor IF-2-like [Panthera pardus]
MPVGVARIYTRGESAELRAAAHAGAAHTEQLSDGSSAKAGCAIALDVHPAGPRELREAPWRFSGTPREVRYFKIQVPAESTQAGLGVDGHDDLRDSARRRDTSVRPRGRGFRGRPGSGPVLSRAGALAELAGRGGQEGGAPRPVGRGFLWRAEGQEETGAGAVRVGAACADDAPAFWTPPSVPGLRSPPLRVLAPARVSVPRGLGTCAFRRGEADLTVSGPLDGQGQCIGAPGGLVRGEGGGGPTGMTKGMVTASAAPPRPGLGERPCCAVRGASSLPGTGSRHPRPTLPPPSAPSLPGALCVPAALRASGTVLCKAWIPPPHTHRPSTRYPGKGVAPLGERPARVTLLSRTTCGCPCLSPGEVTSKGGPAEAEKARGFSTSGCHQEPSVPVVLTLDGRVGTPGGLVQPGDAGLHPGVSDLADLRWGLRTCDSNKLRADAAATTTGLGLGPPL